MYCYPKRQKFEYFVILTELNKLIYYIGFFLRNMINLNKESNDFLSFKIIQSGEIIKVSLNSSNLRKSFHDIFHSLLKELNLKQKDTFLSNEEGKMIGIHELSLSLKEFIISLISIFFLFI